MAEKNAERKLWSLDSMAAALRDVENGTKGLREAARAYHVPVETLRRRATGQVSLDCRSGPSTTLTKEEEKALAEYCIKMSDIGFGLGREDVMRAAFAIVEKSGRPHSFKNGMAGRGWWEGYMRRHPRLSLRKPQPLSVARACASTDEVIKAFFEKLGGIYCRLNLLSKPMLVFNCDETGITVVHSPGRVITEMGRKKVWSMTSGERGKTHTVVTCVSAAGLSIPPMIVYPRVRLAEGLKAGAYPGTLFACSKSGWITQELFLEWFRFFISSIPPTRPVLLIFDGHASHISLELIQLAQEHDVHLLCLPSHTSHLLQPLDVGVFKALKSAFNKACKRYMAENPGCVIRSENIASLLAHAWPRSVTPVNIMSGFHKCGIHPLNPGVIDDRQTAPSQAVGGGKVAQEEQDSPTVSSSNSVSSTTGSGLTTVSPPLQSQCSESSGTGVPQELSDILVLPKPKERGATRRGVNRDAVCITEPEFVEQMKSKELEKQKKLEEAEQKRLERERKQIEKERKKAEKGQIKKSKRAKKGTRREKGVRPLDEAEESDCDCPVCGVNFRDDEENRRWIGCDGCHRWWHVSCLDLTGIPVDFYCSDCL